MNWIMVRRGNKQALWPPRRRTLLVLLPAPKGLLPAEEAERSGEWSAQDELLLPSALPSVRLNELTSTPESEQPADRGRITGSH